MSKLSKLRTIKVQAILEITIDDEAIESDEYYDDVRESGGVEEYLTDAVQAGLTDYEPIMELAVCERVSNGDNGDDYVAQYKVTAEVIK